MYRIKLNEFEGPLDLLLFFIQRDELDIHNIPISKITKEFVEYIQYMQELDLEVTSEFIIMAATLIQIKAKMMLRTEDEELDEETDPRYEIVRKLLEYKRYKDASVEIAGFEDEQRNVFHRNDFEGDFRISETSEDEMSLQNLTMYNLMKAFRYAIEHRPKEVIHNIIRFNVSLDEQINFVISECMRKEYVSFLEMTTLMTEKLRIVVTFIAVLELVKNGIIGIKINNSLTDFEVFSITSPHNLPEIDSNQYDSYE